MCIKSEVEEIFFKLATNDQSNEAFLLTSKCWPQWVVCSCPRAIYMHKNIKNVHQIRGQSCFLKHATSEQSDKTFLLSSNQNLYQVVVQVRFKFRCTVSDVENT